MLARHSALNYWHGPAVLQRVQQSYGAQAPPIIQPSSIGASQGIFSSLEPYIWQTVPETLAALSNATLHCLTDLVERTSNVAASLSNANVSDIDPFHLFNFIQWVSNLNATTSKYMFDAAINVAPQPPPKSASPMASQHAPDLQPVWYNTDGLTTAARQPLPQQPTPPMASQHAPDLQPVWYNTDGSTTAARQPSQHAPDLQPVWYNTDGLTTAAPQPPTPSSPSVTDMGVALPRSPPSPTPAVIGGEANTLHSAIGGTMFMTSAGNVGIGLSSPTEQLHLSRNAACKPGSFVWSVNADESVVEDVRSADIDTCYANVRDLPLRAFAWRDDAYDSSAVPDRHVVGWTAADVGKVFPKAVSGSPLGRSTTMDVSQIITSMYGALQKLQVLMSTNKERLDALDNELSRVAKAKDGDDAGDAARDILRADIGNLKVAIAQLKQSSKTDSYGNDALEDHQLQLDAVKSEIIQLRRSMAAFRSRT